LKGRAKDYSQDYQQFRLLKVALGVTPKMGSSHAIGVFEVVENPSSVFYGKGIRSQRAGLLSSLVDEATYLAEKNRNS
jgi:hypothetical protein